ncbi:MAG TPA: ABC transporter permease subunit [Vicinamibacterales bacterium]|jgi:ABC-type transport system involved in multi-copper enzyme maturation permease subunit|nr:ABC transporter permease subunit [Vicinamibacterales bacterium]
MSPIHDQSYRHYGGTRAAPGRAWTVIAGAGIRGFVRRRAFLGIMLFALFPFIVRAVQIYIAANVARASMLGAGPETFRQFLEQQDFFVFVITVYVGAGLIANDRRANALQIYLSKPLMRTEYIFGKLAVLVVFLLSVTFVPAILLLFLKVVFDGSFVFLRNNLFLLPAITVASVLQVLLASFTMLALSSLSKSARYVGILYVGITFFTSAIYGALYAITGTTRVSWVSIGANVTQVVDVIFRQPPRYATPWPVSLLVIIGLIALSVSILERRVRGVEVVT